MLKLTNITTNEPIYIEPELVQVFEHGSVTGGDSHQDYGSGTIIYMQHMTIGVTETCAEVLQAKSEAIRKRNHAAIKLLREIQGDDWRNLEDEVQ